MAAALVRGKDGWSAAELDLGGVADVEEVADRLRDTDPYADISLLFVEAEDTYLVIMRLDYDDDVRVFCSDAAFAQESRLGGLLLADVETPVLDVEETLAEVAAGTGQAEEAEEAEEEEDKPVASPAADPVGDADLLADLGMPAHRLLAACAREGMLPGDVAAEVAHAVGGGDVFDAFRES